MITLIIFIKYKSTCKYKKSHLLTDGFFFVRVPRSLMHGQPITG